MIKGLGAKTDAVHARAAVELELLIAERSGIRFETDFRGASWKRCEDAFN